MARKKDITDKLVFDGAPSLVINGEEIEVNDDAPTMLRIMGLMSNGSLDDIKSAYELIFPEEARRKIDEMRLSTKNWATVIEEAVSMIMGEDNSPGEQ